MKADARRLHHEQPEQLEQSGHVLPAAPVELGRSYGAQSYSQNPGYAANTQYAGGPAYVYQPLPPNNVLAIIGMCASIFGFVSGVFIGGIAGVVMGHIARKQIK